MIKLFSEVNKDMLSDKDKEIYESKVELQAITKWFKDTDYIPNKIVTHEWEESDYRWQNYLALRSQKRERQDYLNHKLKGLE